MNGDKQPSAETVVEPSIAARVVALTKMTVPELREQWLAVFGKPTCQRHRQHMVRRLAWQLQADASGSLSDEAQAKLKDLQREFEESPPSSWFPNAGQKRARQKNEVPHSRRIHSTRSPKSGSVITRTYHDQQIVVTVRDDGTYEYGGVIYKSLSAIATAVTGTHLSGPAFFGLVGKGTKR